MDSDSKSCSLVLADLDLDLKLADLDLAVAGLDTSLYAVSTPKYICTLYQAPVMCVLLPDEQTWTLLAADMNTPEAFSFHTVCQRQILDIRW